MSKRKPWKERLVLGKNQVFKAGTRFHGEIVENRTIINVESLKREYKLAQAYANVRNLEYRAEKPVKIRMFKEYLAARAELIKLVFKAEQKPRPNFPSDEAYRNTKTSLHYPKGDLLVLVDQAVYGAVKDSIDQYVLDVGRDGYWATIHVLSVGSRPMSAHISNNSTRSVC